MPGAGVPPAEELLRRVEPNLTAALLVRDVLTKVAPPPTELAQVSVSRLLNPGRAYWELVHPLGEELSAHQKRLAGTGAHDLLEEALAAGVPYTELWLHGEDVPGDPPLDRITARLDACEVRPDGRMSPTEIKNVGKERERPADEHLEQLGMYCVLLGVDEGRVLGVLRDDAKGSSRLLVPWKVRYADPAAIRQEMVRRRDLLTEAFASRDPSKLPACPWWWAGCRYREAGVCRCGDQERLTPTIARSATVERDPDYLELIQRRAAEREVERAERSAEVRLTWGSFLTPRKVYFGARAAPGPEPGPEEKEPEVAPAPSEEQRRQAERAVQRVNTRGLERQVFSAVRRANGERYRMAPVHDGQLELDVPVVDGRPFLVRVRHVGRALSGGATELAGRWGVPDDLRQLAVRASLLGVHEARIYVWNWKLEDSSVKLQVFDVRFDPAAVSALRTYATGLLPRVDRALERKDHRDLPLCPRWMCPSCPFLSECRPDET